MYEWEKEVGSGAFGKVYEARHKQLGTKCAMKVMHKKTIEDTMDAVFTTLIR